MKPIVMPQIGQDIPTGKIVEWLKRENEPVEKGEVILVVESEKASFEIEAEESGILLKILHDEGEEVKILEPVGYVGKPGERFDQQEARAIAGPAAPGGKVKEAEQERAPALPEEQGARQEPSASPAARRIARERGVDLKRVHGTGPGGRITKEDVLGAVEAHDVNISDEDTVVPFGKMRKLIAERLITSKQTIPHFHISVDVDMSDAMDWRRRFNTEQEAHITVTDLVIKAAAIGLKKFPRLNAHVGAEKLVIKKDINIGVAVAVENGLLVPVIPNSDQQSLQEISELSKKNTDSARRGVVSAGPSGTFTITSLGMYGVKQFVPIINPPQCAILAVGSVEPRAAAMGEGVQVREMMTLTLGCDHRTVDGAEAAGLLNEIKRYLEEIRNIQGQWV